MPLSYADLLYTLRVHIALVRERFAYYVNTLPGAGFALSRLEEHRPPEECCREHPGQRGWRDHAALYLYLRATKPG